MTQRGQLRNSGMAGAAAAQGRRGGHKAPESADWPRGE